MMLEAMLGVVWAALTYIPRQVDHAIWTVRMKRRLRDLADRLEAFKQERASLRPQSPTEIAEAPYMAAVREWQEETSRLFRDAHLPELLSVQDALDAREISNSQLWEGRELHSPVRLDRIIARLRKLADRNRLLR